MNTIKKPLIFLLLLAVRYKHFKRTMSFVLSSLRA